MIFPGSEELETNIPFCMHKMKHGGGMKCDSCNYHFCIYYIGKLGNND